MGTYNRMRNRMKNEDRPNYDKLRAIKKIKDDKYQKKIEDFFNINKKINRVEK